MPASANKQYFTFVKGLVTEAGPFTYPENASLDEENFVLNRDGSRQRRLGMDFEEDYSLRAATVASDDAVAVFRWYNVANDTDNQFAVVQTGQLLSVYDLNAVSVSGNLVDTVDLSAYITGKTPLDAASGMGFLFLTEGTSNPLYLTYNPTTGVVTVSTINIKIRDFFGVDDGLDVDETPASLSNEHTYNLQNQGWTSTQWDAVFTSKAVYPSNAQQWILGKNTTDDFDAALLFKQDFGTTPAPKGRFVIDAFTRSSSRQSVSGTTVPTDTETGRPTCVAFAFERVFYSGVESSITSATGTSPNMTGYVFFTRVLKNSNDFGLCHQAADPTSEHDSELVDSDGGTINIPASGKIYRLVPKGAAILVFAEMGVWSIYGVDSGFTATTFVVDKVTDLGVLNSGSVVDTEDSVVYWGKGGIYMIQPNESGRLAAVNITENSIQTYYNSIPLEAKRHAVGSFDPVNRRLSWLYNMSDDYDGVAYVNRYDTELTLDVVLGAYSKNTIKAAAAPSPYLAGFVETPDFLRKQEGVRTRFDSVTKYLTVQFIDPATNAAVVTFSYYRNADFLDWAQASGGGVDAEAFVITGHEILEDSMRYKQAPYMVVHCKRTEEEFVEGVDGLEFDNPSSCITQIRWDFSDSSSFGKWTTPFEAYRLKRPFIPALGAFDYGQEVISTKNLIRGRGRALSVKFSTSPGKDLYLYGWGFYFTGETSV